MKKIIRLTESDLTRLVKRVIKEQEQEKNPSECAKTYVEFLFEPSIMKNNKVYDGGDLFYWNNNQIPDINDNDAYNRFIEYLKYCVEDLMTFEDQECSDTTFEDIKPFIKKLYIDEIGNRSNKPSNSDETINDLLVKILTNNNGDKLPSKFKRRLRNKDIERLGLSVNNVVSEELRNNNPNYFRDEFQYAETVLAGIVEDCYPFDDIYNVKIFNYLKEKYGDIILNYYHSNVNDN